MLPFDSRYARQARDESQKEWGVAHTDIGTTALDLRNKSDQKPAFAQVRQCIRALPILEAKSTSEPTLLLYPSRPRTC